MTVLYGPRRLSMLVHGGACLLLYDARISNSLSFKRLELSLLAVQVVFDKFFRNGIGGHHNWHDSITTTILNSYADFYDS